MEFKIKDRGFAAFLLICLVTISAFSSVLFGIVGFRVVLGIIFVSLPFYFIIGNFGFSESEKFVFSFVLGITVFPSLVYALGLLISFRMSIFIIFALLMIASFILWKFRKK